MAGLHTLFQLLPRHPDRRITMLALEDLLGLLSCSKPSQRCSIRLSCFTSPQPTANIKACECHQRLLQLRITTGSSGGCRCSVVLTAGTIAQGCAAAYLQTWQSALAWCCCQRLLNRMFKRQVDHRQVSDATACSEAMCTATAQRAERVASLAPARPVWRPETADNDKTAAMQRTGPALIKQVKGSTAQGASKAAGVRHPGLISTARRGRGQAARPLRFSAMSASAVLLASPPSRLHAVRGLPRKVQLRLPLLLRTQCWARALPATSCKSPGQLTHPYPSPSPASMWGATRHEQDTETLPLPTSMASCEPPWPPRAQAGQGSGDQQNCCAICPGCLPLCTADSDKGTEIYAAHM